MTCLVTRCWAKGELLTGDTYDLVVIGGGIHGAGVAQAAAAAGHTVLVLEKTALADGTSSRSSKLVHGGLRYLESGQFGLVAESLREREHLLRLAPELVQLQRFYLPVYAGMRRRSWQIGIGLGIYALLGRGRHDARFHRVAPRDWSALDGLARQGLQAVYQYWDAQTDDAALTRAVMHSAQSLDAELRVPAEFLAAHGDGPLWQIEYVHHGASCYCGAHALVNAAGPWVNAVLARVQPTTGVRAQPLPAELVQGTHLVLNARLSRGVYYLESPGDARAVFVMPWRGRVLLGTTETPYVGDPAQVRPLAQERRYLLDILAQYFPGWAPQATVCEAFAGLRVLPATSARPFSRPRESVLHESNAAPPLLSIYGGKLTTYRAVAARVLRRLSPRLPSRAVRADPLRLVLSPP